MAELQGRVLVVDDDRAMCELLQSGLSSLGFGARAVTQAAHALELLREQEFDVLLADLQMPHMDGLRLCSESLAIRPNLPVILLTAFGSLETAIEAIRAGAYDFITKPADIEVIGLSLERAVRYARLRSDLKRLQQQLAAGTETHGLIGHSPPMQRVYDLLERVADSDVTVLITGESGTGKELVANALHKMSARGSRPFVAVNCAALPDALLESELFGHVKGAFTDARNARTGLFARAEGGTLFLDEVGEMPLSMQAKLLRALQERRVRPVGADAEIAFDVRIVAATNRDLLAAVEEQRFRQDLYFRLNVLELRLPPLRARGNDILLLAQEHLRRCAASMRKSVQGISQEAAAKLLAYSWPGNVREVHNCIERAVAVARFDQITPDDLPESIRDFSRSHVLVVAEGPSELVPLEEVERRYILRVLDAVQGNRTLAARILGLDRKTLYRKLERWGQER